jgi:hypothetical protein
VNDDFSWQPITTLVLVLAILIAWLVCQIWRFGALV